HPFRSNSLSGRKTNTFGKHTSRTIGNEAGSFQQKFVAMFFILYLFISLSDLLKSLGEFFWRELPDRSQVSFTDHSVVGAFINTKHVLRVHRFVVLVQLRLLVAIRWHRGRIISSGSFCIRFWDRFWGWD